MIVVVHVAVWLLRMLAVLPLWLAGFPICYVLARRQAWEPRKSRFYANPDGSQRILAQWRPRWAYVWGNEEDGVAGPRWFMQGAPAWKRAFVWSAWRNPTNNLRFVYPFGIVIQPSRVRFRGNVIDSPGDDERREGVARFRWSYAWQGAFSGLWVKAPISFPQIQALGHWWQFWLWRVDWRQEVLNFRIGYKILPKDARGVPDYDYRAPGAGFGLQLQLRDVGR